MPTGCEVWLSVKYIEYHGIAVGTTSFCQLALEISVMQSARSRHRDALAAE
jgi:hypothetical protein